MLKWIVAGLAFLLLIIIFIYRKSITQFAKGKVWDYISQDRISTLHPKIREKVTEFINRAEKQGIRLRIISAYRTYQEQDELYEQGRTKAGNIVTNAKGGQSSHNFGTAIDVVPIINGSADWNTDYNQIAQIGKSVGFSWGGDWTSFKDKPHFEMNFGKTIAQLKNLYENGNTTNGYVNLA